jgi:cytochrome c biogenesis protein CcmG/thiol:disulfide interchange protein DsbE
VQLKEDTTDTVALEDLKGSPVIINFWASWCSSCAEEANIFESFWKKHSSEGVKVLGIAVHDKAEDAMSFARSLGKTYAIGLDEEGHAALNYGVTGVPETVFINAEGLVVHKEVGPMTTALLDKYLAELR